MNQTNPTTLSTPPSKTLLSPQDWWDNLNYWWDRGGREQGYIPPNTRAQDCYPSGSPSPSIKDFLLKYQTASIEELEKAREENNFHFLLNALNEAWFYGPGQCGEAWNVLCDLCSECWVFDNEGNNNVEELV